MSAGTARGGPTRPGRMWSVLALWQRLNFRPLPHQQGSLALRAKAVIELVAMARPGYRPRPAALRSWTRGMMGSGNPPAPHRAQPPGGDDAGRARGHRAARRADAPRRALRHRARHAAPPRRRGGAGGGGGGTGGLGGVRGRAGADLLAGVLRRSAARPGASPGPAPARGPVAP